ncbi:MAG TPA: N-6 DNA methylase [Blastocatellia bacterium]|nr:N-6 DNA methylase [Blastocatellia bacterium]
MTERRDERHRYGQHYTPVGVARLLAAFAVRSGSDLVFDPACGDGRLLRAALEAKKQREPQRSIEALGGEVYGLDRSARAARRAASTGARALRADFFNVEPGASLDGSGGLPALFDAIIGNPPYIRQEVMGSRDKRRIEARLARDSLSHPHVFWPRWSGRSDIYVYFFAHSTAFLKEGARLVFLSASSWLDAGYGAALREFLLRNFRVNSIIESTAESFFARASVNTTISVLERESDPGARDSNAVRFVRLNSPLTDILERAEGEARGRGGAGACPALTFARSIESARASSAFDTHRIRVVRQGELMAEQGAGWGRYLRADDVFFRVLERGGDRLRSLSDLASVRFGVKTGANDFFYVTGEEAPGRGRGRGTPEGPMKPLRDVARVRRGLTTGANEFFYLKAIEDGTAAGPPREISVEDRAGARRKIESKFLAPVIFSLKDISGIYVGRSEARKLFFNCAAPREELKGTRALDYILEGERAGYNLRPTCSAREQWYAVARGMKPAPLIFPSKIGERWVVAVNRARAFEDKKLYGVFPRGRVGLRVLAALLNSTWARYYSEVTCRQMTGAQAIADIDVNVAEQIKLPDPRGLPAPFRKRLLAAFGEIARRPVLSIFEEVGRADRRRLDDLTLFALGFDDPAERRAALEEMYAAVAKLVRDRLDKAAAQRSRSKGVRR